MIIKLILNFYYICTKYKLNLFKMAAAVTTAAIGIGVSGFMAYQGAKQKKDAQNALNNYDRQDLKNPYEDIKISTVGTDLMREESGRTSANLVESVQGGDIRAIMGAIPKIQSNTNAVNRQIQVDLDNQVMKREYAIAGDETDLRSMRETRDNNNIAALSSEVEAGKQDMWNGISGVASGLSYGANNIDFGVSDEQGNSGSYAERKAKKISAKGSGGYNSNGYANNLPSISRIPENGYNATASTEGDYISSIPTSSVPRIRDNRFSTSIDGY